MFLASVYPHYYAWWTLWNYFNDDFYEQMSHQFLFTATETISTVVILRLADCEVNVRPIDLLVIISIAAGQYCEIDVSSNL